MELFSFQERVTFVEIPVALFNGEITSRVHGLERMKRDVTAKNVAYNLKRYVCIIG